MEQSPQMMMLFPFWGKKWQWARLIHSLIRIFQQLPGNGDQRIAVEVEITLECNRCKLNCVDVSTEGRWNWHHPRRALHVSIVPVEPPAISPLRAFPNWLLSAFQKHVFTVCSGGESHVTRCFVIVQLKNSCTQCTPILSSPFRGTGHDPSDVAPLPLPKPDALLLYQNTGLPKNSPGWRPWLFKSLAC